MVKMSRFFGFSIKTSVKISVNGFENSARSAEISRKIVTRALASHVRGRGFESRHLHHIRSIGLIQFALVKIK